MTRTNSRIFRTFLLITFGAGFFIWIFIVDSDQNIFPFSGSCHFGKNVIVQVDVSFQKSLIGKQEPTLGSKRELIFKETHDKAKDSVTRPVTIPVLVLGCDRVTAISSHLEQLLRVRATFTSRRERFPIIVSLDCNDAGTSAKVRSFGDDVKLFKQPDQSQIVITSEAVKLPNMLRNIGYYKIARHYKWALDHIFLVLNYSAVIVTEDDLNVAPDFFEYFAATYPLLVKDKSLWCVSAWNDNSKPQLILKDRPELLHRTDFFPGLGWMMRRDLWLELSPKFPKAYWDDWMRNPEQRKGRACIRPEISRTTTFGRNGVSQGQFLETYFAEMQLNSEFVAFTKLNLSYLEKKNYDLLLSESVNNATEIFRSCLYNNNLSSSPISLRVTYMGNADLKELAKGLSAMSDFKSGVIRTAYRGVVSVARNNCRLFLVPKHPWTGYEAN